MADHMSLAQLERNHRAIRAFESSMPSDKEILSWHRSNDGCDKCPSCLLCPYPLVYCNKVSHWDKETGFMPNNAQLEQRNKQLFAKYKQGVSTATLSAEYGLSISRIRDIIRRQKC